MTKCRSVIVDSQGSSPDFGPAKAEGRSQTRPVEEVGPYQFTSSNKMINPIITRQMKNRNEQQVRSYK